MTQDPKVFCAIDESDFDQALSLSKMVSAQGCGLKLGLEFFNRHGPQGITDIHDACEGVPIFSDISFNLLELELFLAPTTSHRSQDCANSLTES